MDGVPMRGYWRCPDCAMVVHLTHVARRVGDTLVVDPDRVRLAARLHGRHFRSAQPPPRRPKGR